MPEHPPVNALKAPSRAGRRLRGTAV